jgi:mRNA interferase MazF
MSGAATLCWCSFRSRRAAAANCVPPIVVQNDRDNGRLANVILAPITTRTHHSGEPTQRLVDPSTTEGQATGLIHLSVVSCENLATVSKTLIARRLGRAPAGLLADIDVCLKAALELH